jgi:hypothetical protein
MTDRTITVGQNVGRQVDKVGMHKYQAVLPDPLWNELQQLADDYHTTVGDLIRRFVQLGLIAVEHKQSGGAIIFRSSDQSEKELVVLI